MSTPHRASSLITIVTAAALATACSGSAPKPAATTPSTSTSSSPSSTSSTSSTPSSTTVEAAPRTAAVLKSALLVLSDLPTGFSQDPPSAQSGNPTASSTNPRCAPFVRLSNAKVAPGSMASAEVSFSSGQSGPSIDESIDALGSAAKVAALQAQLKDAIAACPKVALSIPGAGPATVTVTTVNPPAYGDSAVAARLSVSGGPADGLEITQVTLGVADTIVSLTFVGAAPTDIDGASDLAVSKATKVLSTGSLS